MKKGIHPDYKLTKITCICGNVIETRSTVKNIDGALAVGAFDLRDGGGEGFFLFFGGSIHREIRGYFA